VALANPIPLGLQSPGPRRSRGGLPCPVARANALIPANHIGEKLQTQRFGLHTSTPGKQGCHEVPREPVCTSPRIGQRVGRMQRNIQRIVCVDAQCVDSLGPWWCVATGVCCVWWHMGPTFATCTRATGSLQSPGNTARPHHHTRQTGSLHLSFNPLSSISSCLLSGSLLSLAPGSQ